MWFSTVGLIITLSLSLLIVLRTADVQQPVKAPLIGVLASGFPPSEARRQPSPFGQALRELGWIEGQNIAFERRYAEEQLDRLAGLAAELVRLKPDVIVVSGTRDVLAAKQATTKIPS
jgi:ABC-type uncharacterized transport system substrate-binding protein